MPKLSLKSKKIQATAVLEGLIQRYPTIETHLVHSNPWELLIATVLSAQCTDARVNMVTPVLFARWKTPAELGQANQAEVEEVIRSTGFFRNKAKNIIAAGKMVSEVYQGEIPQKMAELIKIPGVARKTANVVLFGAFGINDGLAVDTHVKRITHRLGLTDNTDPIQVEKDLMKIFPQEEWGNVNHRLVWFGRHVCDAKKPRCEECEFIQICPKNEPKE